MKRRARVDRLLLLGLTITITVPRAAPGVDLPAAVSLDEVLELANKSSPRALAERATVQVAAADRITARALPNPSLSYGGVQLVGGTNTGAATQNQIVVEQPLLLFGQRGVRTEEADLQVTAEKGRVSVALAALRLKVRQAFTALLARQEQLRVLEDSLADLDRVETVVRGRTAAGDRSRYDLARAEVQTRELQVEVANMRTDVTDASGQLAALLGFPGWRPRALGSLTPSEVPTDIVPLWEIAQERRPGIVAVRQRQAAAYGGLTVARREALPIPVIAAGTLLTQDADSQSAVFGISLPLPLFDRNQGAIARATAQADAESLALDAELAEAKADIERASTVLRERRLALAALESDVVQSVPGLRRMAEDAYREGRGGILELLDAFTSLKEIRLLELKQQEQAKLAEGELVSVAGLDTGASDHADE